ncbi:type II toxin-antitoxin system death-on-curing family toxin [Candidatus Woesearchaeota archaeon]|nr:type II toxin-antitoxin system death-on-curing family toxin [Candidatus Woesearchaeota archaeon]
MVNNTHMVNNDNILFCFRCYHTWKRRKEQNPNSCPNPKCHSPYWNKPRKRISKGIVLKMEEMIIRVHDTIIELSGGEHGIRDRGGIYNSTYKLINHQYKNQRNPTSIGTFALNEFAKRHYFTDGNKRVAYAIAKIFMLVNKCHLRIQFNEAVTFILEVAKYESKVTFQEIKEWLDRNCVMIEDKDIANYLNGVFVTITLENDENEK